MESPNSQSDSGNYSPELSIAPSSVKSPEPLHLLADSSLLQAPMQPQQQQVPAFNMQSLLSGGQPQAPAQEAMHAPAAPKEDGMLNPKQFFHLQKAILGKFIKLCWNCNEINFHNQNKFQISDDQKYISCNTVFCISCARGNMENSIQKFAARNKDNPQPLLPKPCTRSPN
jgi:hypothetical protein